MILPSGIHAWGVATMADVTPASCAAFLREMPATSLVLLGTGPSHMLPPEAVRSAFAEAGIGLEAMSTGAACRTYNVLLAEGREVGAGLIAVE
jgi:uncharacterized protein